MNGLHKVAPAIAQKIPHARDIIGFRNILAHGYAEIDHNKVISLTHGRLTLDNRSGGFRSFANALAQELGAQVI